MPQKLMFARLVKADEAKREVSGVMVAEVPDKTGEIFDYESSKPFFKAWNRRFSKVTAAFLPEGESISLGNVREMHKPSVVGKLIACSYDDAEKSIFVTAHIDDDAAWRKCSKGIYTGFSIGGDYVDTWKDETNPGFLRYTANPAEASIVDNPAVPNADFELLRADGSRAMCKFATAELKKDMYGVSQLASLLQQIQYLQQSAEGERQWEKDNSTMPEELKFWLTDGVELLEDMVSEEGAELTGKAGSGDNNMTEKVKESGDLEKKDEKKVEKKDDLEKARHSKATMESLNAIKEHHGKIGKALKAIAGHHETISDCAKSMGEHLDKVLTGTAGQEQTGSNADVKGDDDEDEPHPGNQKKAAETGDLAKVVAELAEVVKAMKDQPAERKAVARVVTKSEDADDRKDEEKVTKVTPITTASGDRDISTEDKSKLFKSIYSNPMADAPLAGRKAV